MTCTSSNILLIIVIIIIIGAVIYYISINNKQPNTGSTNLNNTPYFAETFAQDNNTKNISNVSNVGAVGANGVPIRKCHNISDNIVDDFMSQYDASDNYDQYIPSGPIANNYKQDESTDFTYKKNKFTRRTPDDIEDLFDVQKMLPQEIEENWFDADHLQHAKKIKGTQFIHPKNHMGVNTVGSSLKYGTHDIRGDIPIQKVDVSPWGNSTIEPDTNIRGFCN